MTNNNEHYAMFVISIKGEENIQTPPGVEVRRKLVFATDIAGATQIGVNSWGVDASQIVAALV